MSKDRIIAVFLRYYYVLKKGPHQLSDLFYWPLIDILLWGLTSVWVQTQNPTQNAPLFIMTALIFWQVTWRGALDISFCLLQEFWHRNLVNLFSTPLKINEWIFGVLLLSMSKLAITIGFGTLAVYLLYSLKVFTIGWYFLPFVATLLVFGWTISFLSSSLVIYWGHKIEMVVWMLGFLFAPFSAVFYPVSILPLWAQKISWALPTTYIFEGMRSVLSTGLFPSGYFLRAALLDILYLSISVTIFSFAFQASRRKGLARLE